MESRPVQDFPFSFWVIKLNNIYFAIISLSFFFLFLLLGIYRKSEAWVLIFDPVTEGGYSSIFKSGVY